MTKQELVLELASRANLKKSEALTLVDDVLDIITSSLLNGDNVYLRGLGTFKVKDYPARQAHNPRTGEMVNVPARKNLSYKPSLALKARING